MNSTMKHLPAAFVLTVIIFCIIGLCSGCATTEEQQAEIKGANYLFYNIGDTVTVDGTTYTAGYFTGSGDTLYAYDMNAAFLVQTITREIYVHLSMYDNVNRPAVINTGLIYEGDIPVQ